jgi:16S rRNA (uracil1498-N3)-methyltransferase
MPQFLIKSNNIENDIVTITDSEAKHINTVLRKKTGDSINLIDELGNRFIAVIINSEKNNIQARIVETKNNNLKPFLTLYQCVPKSQKMDFIIEKAVELGVEKITPVMSKYVVVQFDENNIKTKMKRWTNILESAVKQCGAQFIPEITKPIEFSSIFKENDSSSLKLIAWENGKENLKQILSYHKPDQKIKLLIGAEGGFSQEEVNLAQENNWQEFKLKGNILRAETAPISIISIINYEILK